MHNTWSAVAHAQHVERSGSRVECIIIINLRTLDYEQLNRSVRDVKCKAL